MKKAIFLACFLGVAIGWNAKVYSDAPEATDFKYGEEASELKFETIDSTDWCDIISFNRRVVTYFPIPGDCDSETSFKTLDLWRALITLIAERGNVPKLTKDEKHTLQVSPEDWCEADGWTKAKKK